jgi:hypothetical protein
MLNLERIPDQMGYLLLAEDGAVISVSIMIMYVVQVVLEYIKKCLKKYLILAAKGQLLCIVLCNCTLEVKNYVTWPCLRAEVLL